VPTDFALIPPLVGGFWFVFRCQLLYLVSVQLGQAIAILLSAFFGLAFAVVTRAIVFWVHQTAVGGWIEAHHAGAWHFPFSGTALGTFCLAIVAAELSRHLLSTRKVNSWVIRHYGGDLIVLLHDSMVRLKPVSLTLENRKVYVGFVQAVPSLNPERAHVWLLPILSGYRRADDLTLQFTTDYVSAIEQVSEARDLLKVIPISSIKTANLFDVGLYKQVFHPERALIVKA
jgi:hypothetical protein